MPQNNQETIINGSTPMERMRNLLNMPPATRPLDFINPLEKIEQLLTCSICLDRFKHPKLLPCQHSYCMEPCLDGLIDHVKRLVKCPECRAEHPLPFDGVKAFQTNYSLMGFLEIHLQATEENAADLESYIRRYNLERCKVCDEKAEVELCQHCDKKICLECKATHLDMLKRDLGRLMNQVKRVATRISDSSDTLSRGLDCLRLNCDSVKEEIKDYVRRFVKELKKREDSMLHEIDAFQTVETRLVKTTRDNLELESTNITEACNRVDACLKGERDMSEEDLVRFKQIFSEGIDYLRTFNIDVDDISNKKVRFFVGPDPHLLPHAISQFGELQVCTPQFSQKLLSVEQVYVPRFSHIGLESDHYPSKKRQFDPTDANTWSTKQKLDESHTGGSSGGSAHGKKSSLQNQTDDYSGRFKRRQMLEEHAWNRLRNEANGASKRSSTKPNDEPVVPGSNANGNAKNSSFESSPWARIQQMTDNTTTAATAPVKQVTSNKTADNKSDVKNADTSKNNTLVHQTSDPQQYTQVASAQQQDNNQQQKKPVVVVDQKASIQIRLRSRTSDTPPVPPGLNKNQSQSEEEEEEEEEEEDDDEDHIGGSVTPVPVQMFEKMPTPPAPEATLRPPVHLLKPEPTTPTKQPLDWKKYLIPNPPAKPATLATPATLAAPSDRSKENKNAEIKHTTTTTNTAKPTATNITTPRKLEIDRKSSSRESVDSEVSWNERRNRFVRSKTNPELSTDSHDSSNDNGQTTRNRYFDSSNDQKEKRRSSYIGYDSGTQENNSSNNNQSTNSSYLNNRNERESDRKSRYKRKAEKSHSSYLGHNEDDNTKDGSRFDMSMSMTDAPGGKFYQRFANPKHEYAQKSRTLVKFGSKGGSEGLFNWPRGVAVISPTGEIVVCDSSNHRLQLFDRRGNWLKCIGTYGSGKGEFDCLAGICVNKYRQFIITDRYNHRVQIFDANGRHLREFGSHGQTNGRFNSPWGVVVDAQGFIYVCDKDNHRVQIFQADGSFVGKFGGIGNRDGQFQSPHFIAVNRQNHLLVTDSNNHRVQVFDHNGHFMFYFGSEGFHEGQFKYPRGIAVDQEGFIIIADSGNNRVQVFYPDGRFYSAFGGWGCLDGQMKGVEGVAVGDDGHIVVTDRENHRIQVF